MTAAQSEVSNLKRDNAALVKDKESWQKEREEMLATLRSSQNEAKSAMKSIQALQTKLTGAQDQFRALYEAVKPIIAAVCHQEDLAQGLRGIILVLSTRFFSFVRGGFHHCVNDVISFIRVATPNAPLQQIADPTMTVDFAQRWDEAKVELSGLTDQILEQMDVLPVVPPAP